MHHEVLLGGGFLLLFQQVFLSNRAFHERFQGEECEEGRCENRGRALGRVNQSVIRGRPFPPVQIGGKGWEQREDLAPSKENGAGQRRQTRRAYGSSAAKRYRQTFDEKARREAPVACALGPQPAHISIQERVSIGRGVNRLQNTPDGDEAHGNRCFSCT